MTVVDGLYCDDGSEVLPGETCDEDSEEEEIFSFQGDSDSDESWSVKVSVAGLLIALSLIS